MKQSLHVSPTEPADKPLLQQQHSDPQNSDRTSDGFVKVPPFSQQTEQEYCTTTNPMFDWHRDNVQQSSSTVSSIPQHPPAHARYTTADYREQEANDSAASSIPASRDQIVAHYMEYRKR